MPKTYTCSICNQTFPKFADCKIHKAMHSPEKAYFCTWDGCNFVTLHKKSFNDHTDGHMGEQCFVCPHDGCNYRAHTSSNLTYHHKKEHGLCRRQSPFPLPQPQPQLQAIQSYPAQYQPMQLQAMQSYPTQYQPQSTQYQPPPPIHNQLLGVLYGQADTAGNYTMYTGPAMAPNGWTEGCMFPEMMQRRPSEMPGVRLCGNNTALMRLEKYKVELLESRHCANNYIDLVINKYFHHYHWKLKVNEEPTTPYDSLQQIILEILNDEESEQKKQKVTAMTKAICNWFEYCSRKLNPLGHCLKTETDPWTCLLKQLSGVAKNKPRTLQAHQRWSKDHFDTDLKEEFEEKWKYEDIHKTYETLAELEGIANVKAWKAVLAAPASKLPADRQCALDQLPEFAGPILAGISDITGMHCTLFVGSPEPRRKGQLSVITMHEGVDLSDRPKNWQMADKTKFKIATSLFQEFLATCYTEADREGASLDDDSDTLTTPILPAIETDSNAIVEPDATPIAQPSAVDGSSQTKVAKKSQKQRACTKNRCHATPARETDGSSDSSSDSSSNDDSHHSVTKHPAVTAHPDIPASNTSAAADPIIASLADEPIISSPADKPIIASLAGMHDKPASDLETQGVIVEESLRSDNMCDEHDIQDGAHFSKHMFLPPVSSPLQVSSPELRPHEAQSLDNEPCGSAPELKALIFLPSNSPSWVNTALEYLMADTSLLPPLYDTLVMKFIELERTSDFESPSGPMFNLSSENWPKEIHWWVSHGCKGHPVIPDIEKYVTQWWHWWAAVQPSWRNIGTPDFSNPNELNHQDGDWDALSKPGKNRFLSILAIIYWWALANDSQGWKHAAWAIAIADVHWVMSCVIVFHASKSQKSVPGKRAPADDSGQTMKKSVPWKWVLTDNSGQIMKKLCTHQ
ncbi:hypothetical protein BDR06DRAFT_1050581 [Suillus hirtellus]|nr:hypothetical protein BDR06DRAFT_1050581 [Suillus hirtellus]